MELALWRILGNPDDLRRFRDEPREYLQQFRLDEDELDMMANWEVGLMDERGVSSLLMMTAFAKMNGRARMPEYQRKIRREDGPVGAQ